MSGTVRRQLSFPTRFWVISIPELVLLLAPMSSFPSDEAGRNKLRNNRTNPASGLGKHSGRKFLLAGWRNNTIASQTTALGLRLHSQVPHTWIRSMHNPYEVNAPNSTNSKDLLRIVPKRIAQSRNGIAVVAILFGLSAMRSVLSFFYQLYAVLQGINSTIEVTPSWVIAVVLHSAGPAYLSFLLWQYQLAIKNWSHNDELSCLRFAKVHLNLWLAGAVYLVVALAYGCLAAIFYF